MNISYRPCGPGLTEKSLHANSLVLDVNWSKVTVRPNVLFIFFPLVEIDPEETTLTLLHIL